MKVEHLGHRIVVADRGFVFVGDVTREPGKIVITAGAVIRSWGTTKGLGQLAYDGPQPGTVLDPLPRVELPERALIFMIDTAGEKWPA